MKLTSTLQGRTFPHGRGTARIRPFGVTRRSRTARMFPEEAERLVTQAELQRLLHA